jgi:hypothetical protein
MFQLMKPAEYPHPERLAVPNRLVIGPDNWEVIEVFSTPATNIKKYPKILMGMHGNILRGARSAGEKLFVKPEQIEVAILMPKSFEPQQGFEMMLAQIHEEGLTTLAAETIHFRHRREFELSGTGWTGVYFETDQPGLIRSTNEYRDQGQGTKIDALNTAIQKHKAVLTAKPGYLPAWRDAARDLAPAVAAFYILTAN